MTNSNYTKGATWLYIRVSSTSQNTISQEQLADKYNVSPNRVLIDKLSGKDMNRPSLNFILDNVIKGDRIVVSDLSRLSRDRNETLDVVRSLQKKGVTLVIDNMPQLNELLENNQSELINSFLYSIIIEVLSLQNQQSREFIKEKQAQGIEANKEKFIGKQRMYHKDSTNRDYRNTYFNIVRDIENGESINRTAINNGVSRNVVRRIKQEDNIKALEETK